MSLSPWIKYRSLGELPALDKSDAKGLWLVLGIGLGLLAAGVMLSLFLTNMVDSVDPMLLSNVWLDLIMWLTLAAVSALIGMKQWAYYYGNGSPKDGIFVEKIRQVNQPEQVVDAALSIAGGLLVGMCFLPSYWFLVFAFYCLLVMLRCHLTLVRPKYAQKAKMRGEEVPEFIADSVNAVHNELIVKGVLAGWIVSDTIFLAYAVASLLVCTLFLSNLWVLWRIIAFECLVGVLCVLFLHVVRKYSYRWGLWLLQKCRGKNEVT